MGVDTNSNSQISSTLFEIHQNNFENKDVRYYKKTNKKHFCKKKYNNIRTVETQIVKRRLTSIGKVLRMERNTIPGRLLTSWCKKKLSIGRPNFT